MHVWTHGAASARLLNCPVNAPLPWSKRQGYWERMPDYEPIQGKGR